MGLALEVGHLAFIARFSGGGAQEFRDAALQLPKDTDPESEEVSDSLESQGKGETMWQRYAVESFTCLALMRACEHSLKTGAAIMFC